MVYPDALDGGWGDDTFTSPKRPVGDEDVVFLAALIGELQADPRVGDGPHRYGRLLERRQHGPALHVGAPRRCASGGVGRWSAASGPVDPAVWSGPAAGVVRHGGPAPSLETGYLRRRDVDPAIRPPRSRRRTPSPPSWRSAPARPTTRSWRRRTPIPRDGTRVRTERWTARRHGSDPSNDRGWRPHMAVVEREFTGGVTFGAIHGRSTPAPRPSPSSSIPTMRTDSPGHDVADGDPSPGRSLCLMGQLGRRLAIGVVGGVAPLGACSATGTDPPGNAETDRIAQVVADTIATPARRAPTAWSGRPSRPTPGRTAVSRSSPPTTSTPTS